MKFPKILQQVPKILYEVILAYQHVYVVDNRPVKAQPTGYVNPAATNTLSIPQLKQMLDELGVSYTSQTSRFPLLKFAGNNFLKERISEASHG